MKYLLWLILIIVIGFIATGYYFKDIGDPKSEAFIGIGVLIFAFIMMPLFIYHRYKGKDLSNYMFKNPEKDEEK